MICPAPSCLTRSIPLEAVSYEAGKELSRACLKTAGKPNKILLIPEKESLRADGQSLAYVRVLVADENGQTVPSADVRLTAEVSGKAELLGFGSGNPITEENYTKGCFHSFCGQARAVLRAGYEKGEVCLKVRGEGLAGAEITLPVA